MAGQVDVFIIEPNRGWREAIRQVLGSDGAFRIAGDAPTIADARFAVLAMRPAIVIAGMDGDWRSEIESILRWPHQTSLIVLGPGDALTIVEAVSLGASGYATRECDDVRFRTIVQRVADGFIAIEDDLAVSVVRAIGDGALQRNSFDPLAALTERERTVVALLTEGLSSRAIAARIFTSHRTVERHLSNIYRKLGVRSRIEAMVAYERIQRRLVNSESR